MTALDAFLETCAAEIARRASMPGANRALEHGATAFTRAVADAGPIPRRCDRLPVVGVIDEIASSPLVDAYRAASDEVHWVVSPRVDDRGDDTALAPLNEVRALDPVVAGLLVLRSGATYPLHSHPPQELYLPIADGGRWRYGGNTGFRRVAPEALVYNRPHDLHSIEAGPSALLALYVLWE